MSISRFFDSITGGINELRSLVNELDVIFVSSYTLPKVPKIKEHDHITEIVVTQNDSKSSLSFLLDGLDDFWIGDGGESTKSVRRYPGVIVLNGASKEKSELSNLIEKINFDKKSLREFRVKHFENRSSRFSAMHDALPGVITEQLDRTFPYTADTIESVSYSWARKNSVVKVDGKKLIKRLESQIRKPPGLHDACEWEEMLTREMALISRHLDGDRLRQRRPVKVHPVYNLLLANGHKHTSRKIQLKASLPLIIFQSDVPRYVSLKTYDEKDQRKGYISPTVQEDPLIPRLNLYVKKTNY